MCRPRRADGALRAPSWVRTHNSLTTISGGGACLGRVVANDDGGHDWENPIARHADAPCMLADRFRIPRLVDADCSDPAVGLLDHVAADPADAVGHLLVTDLGRL